MPVTRTESGEAPSVLAEDGSVVLTIRGCLDARAGEALVGAVAVAVGEGAVRLEIDLCCLTGHTDEGALALAACRQLCGGVPGGLHYRTGQGPGREALLAAYADE